MLVCDQGLACRSVTDSIFDTTFCAWALEVELPCDEALVLLRALLSDGAGELSDTRLAPFTVGLLPCPASLQRKRDGCLFS